MTNRRGERDNRIVSNEVFFCWENFSRPRHLQLSLEINAQADNLDAGNNRGDRLRFRAKTVWNPASSVRRFT